MQIEVVDNCSSDNPEAIVEELGLGRVRFYRNPVNLGAVANFNVCIERSRGELVHILHGDDFVGPDFYSKIGLLAGQHPEAALLASRVWFVNENGTVTGVSKHLRGLESASRDCSAFYYATPLQYAGTVIRREFYQRHGGFDPDYPYCGDCEMWARAISMGGGVVLPEPLAYYRMHGQSDRSSVIRSADNLREIDRLAKYFESRHPDFSQKKHLKRMVRSAWNQAERFRMMGMADGYEANLAFWRSSANFFQKITRYPPMLYHRWIFRKWQRGNAPKI